MISALASAVIKDLRKLLRDPLALAIWIGIPLFVGVTLSLVFGRGSGAPRGKVLIVDEDSTFLSSFVAQAFGQGELQKMLDPETANRGDAVSRINKGDASAVVIVPKGFQDSVLENRPVELLLIKNPGLRIIPGIVEETLAITAEGAFYLQALAGDSLASFAKKRPTPGEVAGASMAVNALYDKAQPFINPVLLDVTMREAIDPSAVPKQGIAASFFPGGLVMAMFFIAQGLSADLWKERLLGTLRRFASTPASFGVFAGGKILAAAIVYLALGIVGLAFARWVIGMEVARPVAAITWLAGSGIMLYLLMAAVQTLAATQTAANVMTNMVVLPFSMLGGSFFPFETMPPGLARIGKLTPNGWANAQFKALVDGTGGLEPFGILVAAVAVCFAIVLVRTRKWVIQ